MTPENLRRLSTLLDEAFDIEPTGHEAWLAGLDAEAARLSPVLRQLLARHAAGETADLIGQLPDFAPPRSAEAAGDVVGPYRLLRELGRGGMGAVWLAERVDGSLTRKVALKLPLLTWAPGLADRFAREREILAGLEHANIARLYDAGVDQHGRPFMALEFVEGWPIDEFCKQRACSVEARLKLLLQVAEAVAYAHGRLVLHRDLKPGNILVTGEGQVRLLDFGVAKLMEGGQAAETALTRLGSRALTLDYASPEQIRGEAIGTASDVYSLAVVAFEVLAGTRPYRLKRGSAAELEEAVLSADAPFASVAAEDPALKKQLRGDLDAVLNKALKKQPGDRYATVDALAQDWRRFLDGQLVLARRDTVGYRSARLLRRHRLPLGAGALALAAFGLALGAGATAVVIAALLLGVFATGWQARRAREQARMARVEATTSAAVQGFLEGLFRANARDQPDPVKARQLTAKELLDQGAARIEGALADAPEAKLKVLKTLSDMYADIGESTAAVRLAAQRASLAERLHGVGSPGHAGALAAWGVALVHGEKHEAAKEVLTRADEILQHLADPDPALRIEVDLALSELYRYVGSPLGLAHAERAAALLTRSPPSLPLLDAVAALGAMQGFAGRPDEALATLERALALAPTLSGGDARLPNLFEGAARIAEDLGDAPKSERYLRRAIELETHMSGASGAATVGLMRNLARLLTNQGHVREALKLFARARDHVEAWPVSENRDLMTQLLLMLEARAWAGYGHPARAVELYDQSLSLMGSARDNPRSAAIMQVGRCAALTDLGRMADAAAALRAALALRLEFGLDGPDLVFNAVQAAIRLALAEGDPAAALAHWETYVNGAPPELTQAWVLLLRAEIAWAAGDAETAATQAAAAIERMQQPPATFGAPRLASRAHELQGLAHLAQGRTDAAVALLNVALRHVGPTQDATHSLETAGVRVALGRALAAQGERQRARELLEEAHAVHRRHPQVGAQYASPLGELDRLLAAP